jgi:hypothetical protein
MVWGRCFVAALLRASSIAAGPARHGSAALATDHAPPLGDMRLMERIGAERDKLRGNILLPEGAPLN